MKTIEAWEELAKQLPNKDILTEEVRMGIVLQYTRKSAMDNAWKERLAKNGGGFLSVTEAVAEILNLELSVFRLWFAKGLHEAEDGVSASVELAACCRH